MHIGPAALPVTQRDDNAEFAVSPHQLASALDPHCTLRRLMEQPPEPKAKRHFGRPWFIWRDDLELARALNDRLASGAAD